MATFAVNPVSPLALGALNALRPVQPPAVPPAQNAPLAGATALTAQDLIQSLFQRTLQAATLSPIAAQATPSASLAQEVTASLLAALSAPQAPADTTTVPTATTNPAVVQAPDTTPSTAPSSTPPATVIGDLPAAQDALALSSSPDFAMQTALRFGAGVAAQAALAAPVADFGAGLLRDATQVLRTGNLQPRAGGPGPEAFATPQSAIQRILRSYEIVPAPSATQGSGTVDLLV